MSLTEAQPITCPACNASPTPGLAVPIHRSVNVTTNPALKEQLLTGQLFAFTCPSCKRASRVVHPGLVYHDMKADVLIQMDALGTFDQASMQPLESALPKTTRIVRDSNALLEKVKIFDAGLDDRLIEALKLVVRESQADESASRYLFEGTGTPTNPEGSDLRFTVLSAKGASGLAVPRAVYDDLRAKLASNGKLDDVPAWAVIDAEYARLLLTA